MIIRYLSVEDAIAFHDDQINLYGGAEGLRDQGQLASAMFRPQSGYYDDIIEQAAALWESLGTNHPFIDGNKRTSLIVTDVFLQLNGILIICPDDDVWRFMLGLLESQSFTFKNLDAWLRANTKLI
jgi:death-on-curing protein